MVRDEYRSEIGVRNPNASDTGDIRSWRFAQSVKYDIHVQVHLPIGKEKAVTRTESEGRVELPFKATITSAPVLGD